MKEFIIAVTYHNIATAKQGCMVRSRVASIEKAGQRAETGPTAFIEQPIEADLRLNTACRLAMFYRFGRAYPQSRKA